MSPYMKIEMAVSTFPTPMPVDAKMCSLIFRLKGFLAGPSQQRPPLEFEMTTLQETYTLFCASVYVI